MMSDKAIQRYESYRILLSRPDLACLPKRGRKWTLAGDALRRDVIKRNLAAAYVQHRLSDYADESSAGSFRKRAKLQLVPREQRA